MRTTLAVPSRNVALVLLAWVALATTAAHRAPGTPAAVTAKLSEWKVELSEATIAAGPVSFTVTNAGSIPHAFEVEGQGIERETELIQPGSTATLTLTLKVGTYEVYCPVGEDSHVKNGPYSNNVTPISGTFTFNAWDKGATRDSVDGTAEFVTQDGARWKLVMDRVQTKDVPHHPRFGGVIMGLYYHGVTQVHTPLVPTINSAVALWAFAHLYKNDALVTDNAMVHVMLLSRTRRDGDFALECWNCSKNKIEELQLQILPGPGEPKFDAPGGFLFVNWEKSSSRKPAS